MLLQCKTFTGTVTYMSPERLEGKPYNFKGDIWGLGLVLLECLTGVYPYHAAAASGVPLEIIAQVSDRSSSCVVETLPALLPAS